VSDKEEPESVRIEPATPEHLPDIAALAEVIWRAHYPGIISPAQIDYMLARMYDLAVLRDELASGVNFQRALVNSALRGFASFERGARPGEFKLHKLYVHPDWQHRGVGRALLAAVEQQVSRAGGTHLKLNVNKRNERAIAMYRRRGFMIHESVVVDIGGNFVMDDYVMVKPIQQPA
jgi:ribosomal protein S18 acetylase RimI-like enzyme